MSYSFGVRAKTKTEAKQLVEIELDKVAAAQACHVRDKAQALAVASAFIDLLADDDTQDVTVSMNGSLTGQWSGSDVTVISGASVSVSAYLAAPQ